MDIAAIQLIHSFIHQTQEHKSYISCWEHSHHPCLLETYLEYEGKEKRHLLYSFWIEPVGYVGHVTLPFKCLWRVEYVIMVTKLLTDRCAGPENLTQSWLSLPLINKHLDMQARLNVYLLGDSQWGFSWGMNFGRTDIEQPASPQRPLWTSLCVTIFLLYSGAYTWEESC